MVWRVRTSSLFTAIVTVAWCVVWRVSVRSEERGVVALVGPVRFSRNRARFGNGGAILASGATIEVTSARCRATVVEVDLSASTQVSLSADGGAAMRGFSIARADDLPDAFDARGVFMGADVYSGEHFYASFCLAPATYLFSVFDGNGGVGWGDEIVANVTVGDGEPLAVALPVGSLSSSVRKFSVFQ